MYLTKQKKRLFWEQLAKLLYKAANRSVKADFLFVLIEGHYQTNFQSFNGAVSSVLNPVDLTLYRFASIAPLFSKKIANKIQRLMNELDLSPYLIDVYIHSQQIADWHNDATELDRHLTVIEQWWNRHLDTGSILQTGVGYMMLAHLNMLKGYLYQMDASGDWKSFNKRIFRIQAEIIEEFGHANALWENGRNPIHCN